MNFISVGAGNINRLGGGRVLRVPLSRPRLRVSYPYPRVGVTYSTSCQCNRLVGGVPRAKVSYRCLLFRLARFRGCTHSMSRASTINAKAIGACVIVCAGEGIRRSVVDLYQDNSETK
jgi:hypothetical protein